MPSIPVKPNGRMLLHRNRNRILVSYPFDGPCGAKMRNIGSADGTMADVAGSPLWEKGPDGWEMIFDGTNDSVISSDGGTLENHILDNYINDGNVHFGQWEGYTVRVRFRTTTTTTVMAWIRKPGNGTGLRVLFNYPTAGQCKWYVVNGDENALDTTGTPALNNGQVHEVLFCHDRRTAGFANYRQTIYVDGQLNATRLQPAEGPHTDGFFLYVGADDSFGVWTGRMSLFEVHMGPLTARDAASYWADPWQDYRPPDYARMSLVAGVGGGGGDPPDPGQAVEDDGRSLRRRRKLKRH